MANNDLTVKIVTDDCGQIALSVDGYLNKLTDLFAEKRNIINKDGSLGVFEAKYLVNSVADDDQHLEFTVYNPNNPAEELKWIETIEDIGEAIRIAREENVALKNGKKDFYRRLATHFWELIDVYHKDEFYVLCEIIRGSNAVILRDGTPVIAVKDTYSNGNIYTLFNTSVWVDDSDEDRPMFIFTDFNVASNPKFQEDPLWYSPYNSPEDVLLGISYEESKDKDGGVKQNLNYENSEFTYLFYPKNVDKVFKINGKLDRTYFIVSNIEILDDYNNTKDFVKEHYNNLPAIYNELSEKINPSIIDDLTDFLD